MTMIVLFSSLILLILLSVPIGISIGLSTLIVIVFFTNDIPFTTYVQKAFIALDSFPLMAIPFFILAGLLMGGGGISRRLLNLADALIGFVVGGLAMVTVVACMFFSAISGSGPATVAAIGSFMIPSMRAKNYGGGFAAALTAAAGSIGVIIPPSIPFVLFGVVGSVSIGGLFLAGVLPGILIGLCLMAAAYLILKRRGFTATAVESANSAEARFNLKNVWRTFWDAKWAILTPVVVLGGIYGKIFTPTEASAVAVLYGFIVGKFIYKELSWAKFYDCVVETLKMLGGIMYMIGLSVTFAYVLNIERIPNKIAESILAFSENGFVVLMLIMVFLLIVGCFIDTISAIVILTPILLPVVTQIGIDPIHFGVIMIVNLAVGYITPPVGTNLFVASQISGVSFEKVSVAMIPFFLAMVLALIIINFVPFLSMFLPSLILK